MAATLRELQAGAGAARWRGLTACNRRLDPVKWHFRAPRHPQTHEHRPKCGAQAPDLPSYAQRFAAQIRTGIARAGDRLTATLKKIWP